jgi:hypothetical protein
VVVSGPFAVALLAPVVVVVVVVITIVIRG